VPSSVREAGQMALGTPQQVFLGYDIVTICYYMLLYS
jgi:hypothetical protein